MSDIKCDDGNGYASKDQHGRKPKDRSNKKCNWPSAIDEFLFHLVFISF